MKVRTKKLRATPLVIDADAPLIYGCCGVFDMCADEDLISLSMQGADPFLDWLGFERTDVCIIRKEFITWIRPEQVGGAATAGYVGDPCADPNGTEWGKCDFTLENWGRIRREGPVRDVTINDVRYCERQPRFRLDGSPISNDDEYDSMVIAEVMLQDLRRYTITGTTLTAGLWDGLQRLVRSGYTDAAGTRCTSMDSIVVDWNGNSMAGGAGVTWNGGNIGATYSFVDVLLDVARRIKQRISYSPTLAAQAMSVGDIILLMPTFMTRCLLDLYTCWSVCGNGGNLDWVVLQSLEGRTFRNRLMGGMFGFGRIFLDDFEIPLIAYDWELITGNDRGDVYLLTGQVGNVKTMQYQYLDMTPVPRTYPEIGYDVTDGGRFLHWVDNDETCVQRTMEIRPRMLSWAPWANARFQDVRCETPTGALSPDPDSDYFFEDYFYEPECP